MPTVLWVALGGVVGTLARYGFYGLMMRFPVTTFPWGTFIINVTGSFLIGFFVRYGAETAMSHDTRAALTIGFCGAYTTFSTYSYETVHLLQDGHYLRASAYALSSVVVCLVATTAGIAAAGRLA